MTLGRILSDNGILEIKELAKYYISLFQFNMGFVSAIRFVFSHFIIENDPEKIDILLSSFS